MRPEAKTYALRRWSFEVGKKEPKLKVLWLVPTCMNMQPVVCTLPGENYFYMEAREDKADYLLIQKVDEVRPELIIYISVAAGPYFVKSETVRAMSAYAPVINFCCDAACPGWEPGLRYYYDNPCFEFTVNIDGNDNWLKGPRDLTLWCPLDPSFYKPKEKTISLGWAGGLGSPDRNAMMTDLKDIITIMPRNEKWGSYNDYADFLSSCKITLNMAKSGSGLALQTKNRVREAGYAGCLLLEERGSPTERWFDIGEDYLDYGSSFEVRAIVASLDESDIVKMAKRFQEKVLRLYNPHLFWEKVLANL